MYDNSIVVVVLQNKVREIGEKAFMNCVNLRQIEIPNSVISIADDAFDGCTRLTIICSNGSYAQEYAVAHGISWREK